MFLLRLNILTHETQIKQCQGQMYSFLTKLPSFRYHTCLIILEL